MARISVIIPYYNNSKTDIEACVDSVIRQKIDDVEIVIVNDGSRAEFVSILDELVRSFPGIRVINQENAGPSAARNRGVLEAAGEYITFLDADDEFIGDALKKMLSEAKQGADFIIGGAVEEKSAHIEGQNETALKKAYSKVVVESDEEKAELKCRLVALGTESDFPGGYIGRGPVSRLVKRTLALSNPFDEMLIIGEDIVWNLGLLDKCCKAIVCYDVWYYYKDNPQSITKKADPYIVGRLDDQLKVLVKLMDLEDDRQYRAFIDHVYENIYIIWKNSVGVKSAGLSNTECRNIEKLIYNESPWTMAGETRYRHLSSRNKKIAWLFYKMKMIFLFCRIR